MSADEEHRGENEALRERIALLNTTLCINASLDLDAVLQEVVDTARALTAAAYGAITTVDDAGEVQDFVTSGFTHEDRPRVATWPCREAFFEHLRNLPGVLRLDDLPGYIRSLGYAPERTPSKTMQATPMHHRDRNIGSLFLGEKVGAPRFAAQDEEILVQFAAKASTAVANARAPRRAARSQRP